MRPTAGRLKTWRLHKKDCTSAGPLLDLCGLAALGAGIGAGNLPPALAVGYSVTALGALFTVGFFLVLGTLKAPVMFGMVCCLLLPFLVPLLWAS